MSEADLSASAPLDLDGLVQAAGLDLSTARREAVAAVLGEWWPACLELNQKMSDPSRQDLVPITVLGHSS